MLAVFLKMGMKFCLLFSKMFCWLLINVSKHLVNRRFASFFGLAETGHKLFANLKKVIVKVVKMLILPCCTTLCLVFRPTSLFVPNTCGSVWSDNPDLTILEPRLLIDRRLSRLMLNGVQLGMSWLRLELVCCRRPTFELQWLHCRQQTGHFHQF